MCIIKIYIVLNIVAVSVSTEIYRYHNGTVLEELQPGDMIEFDRDLYTHWGVYVGKNVFISYLP